MSDVFLCNYCDHWHEIDKGGILTDMIESDGIDRRIFASYDLMSAMCFKCFYNVIRDNDIDANEKFGVNVIVDKWLGDI